MTKREQKKKLVNELTKQIIEDASDIEFIEYKHIDELRLLFPPPVTFDVKPWEELSSMIERDDDLVVVWIIDMLKSEHIKGKFIFMFGDLQIQGTPDFAEVSISESYRWVAPLWKRGHSFFLMSIERMYCWKVFSFDDRYAFLRIKLEKA